MSYASLSDAIRKELSAVGMPSVLEIAFVSTAGKVLYSDLGKAAMSRISPFYESIQKMALGDNLSLALDSTKTIVASRISSKTTLIVLTDKKVGIVLTKMGSVTDKFGRILDEIAPVETSRSEARPLSEEVLAESTPYTAPSASIVEEVQPPSTPSHRLPAAPERVAETPAAPTEGVKEADIELVAEEKETAEVAVPLSPWTILEATVKSKTEGIMLDAEMIKLLRSVDGWKTADVLAKEGNIKLERALKKLSLLVQKGILKPKYDEPFYDVRPSVVGKLDSDGSFIALGGSMGRIRSLRDVLKPIDGKKTVLAIAKELSVDPQKLRTILENLERKSIVKL